MMWLSWWVTQNTSFSLRRLNNSPEVTDSAPLRNESLAGAKKSSTGEVVVDEVDSGTRGASFKIQREKHHDQTVELYGTLPSSGPETGEIQTEEVREQVMTLWMTFRSFGRSFYSKRIGYILVSKEQWELSISGQSRLHFQEQSREPPKIPVLIFFIVLTLNKIFINQTCTKFI